MRSYRLYLSMGLVLSIIIIILSITIASFRTSWTGRAENQKNSSFISSENSYTFASPIRAAADGKSIIRITVFILDSQGLGIPNQLITLSVNGPVTVGLTAPTSDALGRTLFDLTSATAGSYTVSAAVGGTSLIQKATVSFY